MYLPIQWILTCAFTDNTRFLLVRLLLRKQQWHPISALSKYESELGDTGLLMGFDALCKPPDVVEQKVEIIDLTMDSDDEEDVKPLHQSCNADASSSADSRSHVGSSDCDETLPVEPNFDYYCEDERNMTLQEALERLSVEQLKDLVKKTKIKPSKNTVRRQTSFL